MPSRCIQLWRRPGDHQWYRCRAEACPIRRDGLCDFHGARIDLIIEAAMKDFDAGLRSLL